VLAAAREPDGLALSLMAIMAPLSRSPDRSGASVITAGSAGPSETAADQPRPAMETAGRDWADTTSVS